MEYELAFPELFFHVFSEIGDHFHEKLLTIVKEGEFFF